MGRSVSITGSFLYVNGGLRCVYSSYHPKAIGPLVCCHFSFLFFWFSFEPNVDQQISI